ncbi:MAG: 2-phosphosulfolactate phosphatase [Verrucomicrobiota bacterium]|jgi:2-phosphosulfolactate phosphatase
MRAKLEVLFTPAEFSALKQDELAGTVCVVFDVLRATTSMLAALDRGALRIFPVAEIAQALELQRGHPGALLAGEREGVRIRAAQTGGVDFDLGNSPREFTAARVAGREIIMTTTNGTRALQACLGAQQILAGAVVNLAAVAEWIAREKPSRLLIICAGTFEEAAYEDTWAAGALCELVWKQFQGGGVADSAQIAREIYLGARGDSDGMAQRSRNARRLLANPDLRDDVAFCLQRDVLQVAGELRNGAVEKMGPPRQ